MIKRMIFLGFSIIYYGCDTPFFSSGDQHGVCLSTVSHTVKISDQIDISTEYPLLIVYVQRKSTSGSPPLDAKGIPIGDTVIPYANVKSLEMKKEVRSYSDEIDSVSSNWAFAFIDKNRDGILNIGEPFGVNKNNPAEAICRPYHGIIEINSIY
jgi:hypothetical protein